MIEKTSIIITSLGRTGTTFMTALFRALAPGDTVLHEPGMIDRNTLFTKKTWQAIRLYGLAGAVLKKLIGRRDIEYISNLRLAKKITAEEAAARLVKVRNRFVNSLPGRLYVESSYHYYGLLDVLPLAFANCRAAYIIRDPRDWVRSWMNKKNFFDPRDINVWLGNRPTPKMVNDRAHLAAWKKYDNFEKLAWSWNYINRYALDAVKQNPHVRLYRFEDIINSEQMPQTLVQMAEFLLNLPLTSSQKNLAEDMLKRRIHPAPFDVIPKWNDWGADRAKILNKHCGSLMQEQGYGREATWLDKIN